METTVEKKTQLERKHQPKGWKTPDVFNGQVVLAVETMTYEESLEETTSLSRFLATLTLD